MTRTMARVGMLLALLSSACGYALAGRGNSLPPGIVTIGVPDFVNQSTVPDIDRLLTTAVRTEWSGKGKYRILPAANAVDAVLKGTVLSVVLQPVAFNASNQVSRNAIVVTASIEFREVATDKVIWSNPAFRATDEADVTNAASPNDPAALFNQNQDAMDRLSKNFAKSVVTSIFEAF
jgi:Lipopolysaccharide-assembly